MNTPLASMSAEAPLRFEAPPAAQLDKLIKPAEARGARDQGRHLRCAACGNVISDETQRMEVAGAHEHTRTNPHGLTFHIGCFRSAPGCRHLGQRTLEDTWFPGYAWEVSVCAACGQHLGWRFRGAAGGFHGLILARLVTDSPHQH